MKHQIATDQNQSARLIACGVDPKSADMVWTTWENDGEKLTQLSLMDEFAYEAFCLNPIPAWSLSRLLSLLPMEIRKDGIDFTMMLKPYPHEEECYRWSVDYYDSELEATAYYSEAPDPIEACVRMVEKLTDNGYNINEINPCPDSSD